MAKDPRKKVMWKRCFQPLFQRDLKKDSPGVWPGLSFFILMAIHVKPIPAPSRPLSRYNGDMSTLFPDTRSEAEKVQSNSGLLICCTAPSKKQG